MVIFSSKILVLVLLIYISLLISSIRKITVIFCILNTLIFPLTFVILYLYIVTNDWWWIDWSIFHNRGYGCRIILQPQLRLRLLGKMAIICFKVNIVQLRVMFWHIGSFFKLLSMIRFFLKRRHTQFYGVLPVLVIGLKFIVLNTPPS